jgi:hypothetical protein
MVGAFAVLLSHASDEAPAGAKSFLGVPKPRDGRATVFLREFCT